MSFNLKSPFKPSGDQPQAIQKIIQSFEKNEKHLTLMGVTGSGKTITMAHVIEHLKLPTLVLTHNKTLAAQLYSEFRLLFPNNTVEYFISYYDYYQPEAYMPVTDTFIQKDASVNDEIDMLRLRATTSLLERQDVIVVSSVSCIYGLGSPEEYQNSVIFLETGTTIKREQVIKDLTKMQYKRNDIDFTRGCFRVRGDVLEVLPSYSKDPIRVEFFGDEIESISQFEAVTGKVKEYVQKSTIYPAKHFVTSPEKLQKSIKKIEDELIEQIQYFHKNNKPLEAERIQQRTKYDIEMLLNMGYCSGIENYSLHLTQRPKGSRPACLLDYFPKDFFVCIDESHVTIPQIGGMYQGDQSRKKTLIDFGFRLPSALDNRPLNFTEFETLTPKTLYVSATPAEYELKRASSIIEQVVRPTGLLDPIIEVRSSKNQLDDLLLEIQARVKANERTFITTLTKKMSEDLTDFLLGKDVKIRYLHSDINSIERVEILRDLRKGEFDVLVGINLLREGLDIPEVSLVAILDADKEGFLRSRTSIIQTIGRAARNINGKAILYADKITRSMNIAIKETERRRKIQDDHNKKKNITPTTIKKNIVDMIERNLVHKSKENKEQEKLFDRFHIRHFTSRKKQQKAIQSEMEQAAELLNFEKAILLRELLISTKKQNS